MMTMRGLTRTKAAVNQACVIYSYNPLFVIFTHCGRPLQACFLQRLILTQHFTNADQQNTNYFLSNK